LKNSILLILSFFFFGIASYSQREWFGNLALGPMNYTGDLLDKQFAFKEMKFNGSIGITYQYTPNFFVNGSIMIGKIGATDAKNGPKWVYRNLSFQTMLYELSATAEYDFYDITQYENSFADKNPQKYTPYVFAGLGLFHFNPNTKDTAGRKVFLQPLGTEGQTTPYSLWGLSIPYGVGIKYSLGDGNTILSAEFCIRKLFTDYLDDVSKHEYPDSAALLATHGAEAVELSYRANEIPNSPYVKADGYRGNPYKKDGYYSFVVKISIKLFTGKPKFYYGY
jgi:hypothetical protein